MNSFKGGVWGIGLYNPMELDMWHVLSKGLKNKQMTVRVCGGKSESEHVLLEWWVNERVRVGQGVYKWAPVLITKWMNNDWENEEKSESASDFGNQSLFLIF